MDVGAPPHIPSVHRSQSPCHSIPFARIPQLTLDTIVSDIPGAPPLSDAGSYSPPDVHHSQSPCHSISSAGFPKLTLDTIVPHLPRSSAKRSSHSSKLAGIPQLTLDTNFSDIPGAPPLNVRVIPRRSLGSQSSRSTSSFPVFRWFLSTRVLLLTRSWGSSTPLVQGRGPHLVEFQSAAHPPPIVRWSQLPDESIRRPRWGELPLTFVGPLCPATPPPPGFEFGGGA